MCHFHAIMASFTLTFVFMLLYIQLLSQPQRKQTKKDDRFKDE